MFVIEVLHPYIHTYIIPLNGKSCNSQCNMRLFDFIQEVLLQEYVRVGVATVIKAAEGCRASFNNRRVSTRAGSGTFLGVGT